MPKGNTKSMTIDGYPVVDATKPIVLGITLRDVKKGATKDPGSCAAALACLREVKGAEKARVHIGRTYIKIGKKWLRFLTPAALKNEIVAFDRGGKFAPGEYTIRPLWPSHRGTDRHLDPKKPSGKRKKRAKYHMTTDVRARGANR